MDTRPAVMLFFEDVTSLDYDGALEVLAIRNEAAVRRNMYTDHEISQDEHFAWIDRLRGVQDSRFFAVVHEDRIVGGVSVSSISTLHKRADWAFYLSENCQGKGIGSALERQFVTFAFAKFGIEKLNCEVIAFNEKVIQMHQHFGFVIEGVRRDHVIRGGKKFGAVLLGITKQEWEART